MAGRRNVDISRENHALIPWGNAATVKSGDKKIEVITGSAELIDDKWSVPVLSEPYFLENLKNPLNEYVNWWRKNWGYDYI